MDLLSNTVQTYAWGSPTAIPELLGVGNPHGAPQAELWMGAHSSAPSRVVRQGVEMSLDAVVAADPAAELGEAVAARFGGRLPFLLKVIAPVKALSIQLHPDRAQAEAGFAAEEARGVPRRARERVYVDDWPKPELLCALTPFEVLAGLRPGGEAARVLDGLGVAALDGLAQGLRGEPGRTATGRALAALLDWPEDGRGGLVAAVVEAAAGAAGRGGEFKTVYEAVGRIAADFPGDIGLVCCLLMNHLVVEPGQALFMDAGGVHGYVRGTGVEVMANSDNVIRAGLTPKHVDVPELVRVLDPEVAVPVLTARAVAPGVEVFDTRVPEFALRRLTVEGGSLTVPGEGSPRVLFCARGEVSLTGGTGARGLRRGESVFLSAADGPVAVAGAADLFLASPGL